MNQAAKNLAIASCAGLLAIAASGLLTGCNSAAASSVDRADYSTTLNRYYEGRPMCLWPESITFPVQAITPDQATLHGFDALVDAGLLDRKRTGKTIDALYTYDLTKEGHSALDRDIDHPSTGNFCYGHRKIVGIDDDRHSSPTTERIAFHYQVAQPASWATEISIQRAFPQVVDELSGPHKAAATLLDTDEGWEVSGTPATIAMPPASPPSSSLAKAKALLHLNKKQTS